MIKPNFQSSMSVINVRFPSTDDLHFPLQEAKFLGHGFLTTGPNNSHYQTVPFFSYLLIF